MGHISLVDTPGLRHYLLDKTQHLIGGFGKAVGEPPGETIFYSSSPIHLANQSTDIYHSYLGMVALALVNEPGIAAVDPALCAGAGLLENVKSLPWWQEQDV
jgi:geranylgeranyl transferase type-1 subunit beta